MFIPLKSKPVSSNPRAVSIPSTIDTDQEWLELVLENSSDAIIIIDRRRMIRYANKAAAGLAGIAVPRELFGRSYDAILAEHVIYDEHGNHPDPDLFPSNVALFRGIALRDKVVRHMHSTSGKQRWLSVSGIPLFVDTETMQARYAIVFFTDISDRKLREDRVQLLIESSKILSVSGGLRESLLANAKLIVPLMADWCTVNLLNEGGTIERVAVAHRDQRKDALVEKLANIADANTMTGVVHTGKAKLLPHLERSELSANFPTEEGRALLEQLNPTSTMVLPIMSGGRVLGALSLAYADSGRIYTQEDLEFMQEFSYHLGVLVDNARLYQEIEKRDKSKDKFIAALSHELRNPLAPIRSAIDLLKAKNADPELKDPISTIDRQFDHVNKILRDLLDVNRFLQGKVTIDKKLVDLRAVLEKAAEINKPILTRKHLALHLYIPGEPLYVEGDDTRLQQAVMNIVHNAEKFTKIGGNVWIELRREDTNAVISIRDDGQGIAPEDLATIFDPYARKQSSTGLGLGLSLVRDIAQLHDGEVRAKSLGEGEGSTFEITLPLSEKTPSEQTSLPLARLDAPVPQKILVVDDNVPAAKGLAMLLRYHGHTTALAHTGEDALHMVSERDFEPTALLVDIGLPDISGYEVARRLRAEYGNDMLLIALTGYGQPEDIRLSKEAGFNHHLTKPVSIGEVQALLVPRPSMQ